MLRQNVQIFVCLKLMKTICEPEDGLA